MKYETKWSIDSAHSEIAFSVKHKITVNVRGTFSKYDAVIYASIMDVVAVDIDMRIDSSSADTGNPERDERLKDADFFNVEKYKQITFISNTIGQADDKNNHEMIGDLTIKGITKTIKLNVVFGGMVQHADGNERVEFKITGKINRKDWELSWNNALESGGELIGEEVNIICTVQLVNYSKNDAPLNFETWMESNCN